MGERLQKILSQAGVASRRAAEALIREGRVTLNNEVVVKLGTVADPLRDEIRLDGKLVTREETILYLMLNKPAGYVTTMSDPQGRPIVTDLLVGVKHRVYPVGRLDYDSEGLLLFTNDGTMAHRLMHPSYQVPRTYRVKLRGVIADKDLRAIADGLLLDDGPFKPLNMTVEKVNRKSTWLLITIHEGRSRIIRRVFEKFNYFVLRLIRIRFGRLELGDLPVGRYRYLKKAELLMPQP